MAKNDPLDIPSVVLASDTVDSQASLFSRIEDAALKGIPSAAISGALSIYNTFLDYGGEDMVDTEEAIRNSMGADTANYYAENSQVLDVAGFVATSMVPGALGIRALKLAQAGKALGPISRSLRLPSSLKDHYMRKAIKSLSASGGSITSSVTAAKRAQLAWTAADSVLMSAAAELAVVASMNDSPIFEGQDAYDFMKNVTIGAAFGGVLGTTFETLATRGALRQVQRQIEGNRRLYDTVFDPVRLGLSKSDEISTYMDSILALPDEFMDTTVQYRYSGNLVTRTLNTAQAFKSVKSRTEQMAFANAAIKFNELADGGEITGQALYRFVHGMVKSGREKGLAADRIKDEIQGYLLNIKKVTPLADDAGEIAPPSQFFITKAPTSMEDLFSTVRTKDTGKQAYYLTTQDSSQIKFGFVKSPGLAGLRDAFREGYDAVKTTTGRIAINPASKVVVRMPDQALNTKFYLDLESGRLTPTPVTRAIDTVKRQSDLKIFGDSVRVNEKSHAQAISKPLTITDSALVASTRYMWARDGLTDAAIIKQRVIEWNDFPVLERLSQMETEKYLNKNVKVRLKDGFEVSPLDYTSLGPEINKWKLQALQDVLEEAGKANKKYDTRFLSDHFNVSQKWIEEAIGNNFSPSQAILAESRKFDEYFKPRTIQLEWDAGLAQMVNDAGTAPSTSFVGPNFAATAQLSQEYRLKTRLRVQDNAADSVLGTDADRFMAADEALALNTSEQGAGASLLGASNADYGRRAEQWVQETGKQVALVSQRWRDEVVGALNSRIVAVRDSLEASAELGIVTNMLRKDPRKYYLDRSEGKLRLVDREAFKLASKEELDLDTAIEYLRQSAPSGTTVRGEIPIRNAAVFDFLETSSKLNATRVNKQTTLANAMGVGRELDARVVYAPPVDTARYPHFAFVVSRDRVGQNSEVTMITAKSADQLKRLAADVGEDYTVVFKEDTKAFFKAKNIYDYDMQLNESKVNSTLQRKGTLSDFFPETRGENVLDDYVRWHANSSENLVRTAVQVKNRQFFSEMRFLSDQFTAADTSKVAGQSALRRKLADPFGDYIKTALNISKQNEFPLLDSFNEFVDGAGKRAYSAIDGAWSAFTGSQGKDLLALNRVEELMDFHGLKSPYSGMEAYLVANEKMPKNLIKTSFQKVNYWLATTTLRLDFANSLVNIISTPIMLGTEMQSIKSLMKDDPKLVGKLAELTSVKIPGRDAGVPSTTKMIGNAIANYFGPKKTELVQRYVDNGDIKTVLQLYHEVLDDLAYEPGKKAAEWSTRLDAAVEKGAKITGNEFSEQFTRFVSADVMRQLTDPLIEAGKMTVKEQNSYISSFVNRVQGNYIASQRPAVFQGTTGAAVGLFQTYAFNVLQQLLRHMGNKDAKTLLTFTGLQSTIYGLNGLPFFDAINTHLIGNAAGNKGHVDAYELLPQANKEIGDWMLYGTASAFPLFGDKLPALYSRGDMNPRHLTILPINPLDIPAVNASIKLVDSVVGFGKKAANGADLSSSFLQALEHHGWNRPLAGFAQLLAGQSTTGKGSLISAANDMEATSMLAVIPDRIINYGGVARLMGSRPMDEAVALSGFYRNKAYEAKDRARLEALGQAIKTKLYNNQVPDDEEFEELMASYQGAGGRIETFSSSLQRWMKDSNESIVNQMAKKTSSPYGRKMMTLMGGEELPDYRDQLGAEQAGSEFLQ